MPTMRTPRLLIFDSGLGGLTVLRALRQAVPEAGICFVADDARFPYGELADAELTAGLCDLLRKPVADFSPDAIIVACNTASTVALPALRAAYAQPVIGTVPAIKPAALLSESGLVSVLGTSATVRRDYTHALINEHGQGRDFTLVGAPRLAALCETAMAGGAVSDEALTAEIAPCFIERNGRRTDVVVLACTHYPLLRERMDRLAPWPVNWLDPAPAIARRTANVLAGQGFAVGVGHARDGGQLLFTSGKAPSPALMAVLDEHALTLAKKIQSG